MNSNKGVVFHPSHRKVTDRCAHYLIATEAQALDVIGRVAECADNPPSWWSGTHQDLFTEVCKAISRAHPGLQVSDIYRVEQKVAKLVRGDMTILEYLDDQESSADQNKVDLWVMAVDESQYWSLDARQRAAIERVVTTYLYDDNLDVHMCELTPSIELYPIDTSFWFRDDVDEYERDEVENELRQHVDNDVTYWHRSDVEKYPDELKEHLGEEVPDVDDYADGRYKWMDDYAAELSARGVGYSAWPFKNPATFHESVVTESTLSRLAGKRDESNLTVSDGRRIGRRLAAMSDGRAKRIMRGAARVIPEDVYRAIKTSYSRVKTGVKPEAEDLL